MNQIQKRLFIILFSLLSVGQTSFADTTIVGGAFEALILTQEIRTNSFEGTALTSDMTDTYEGLYGTNSNYSTTITNNNLYNPPRSEVLFIRTNTLASTDEYGIPQGEQVSKDDVVFYDNSPDDNAEAFELLEKINTATNFVAVGGAGWIEITNNFDTIIYLRNGVTWDVNNADTVLTVGSGSSFTSDLTIHANPNTYLNNEHNTGNSMDLYVGGKVFINGGTYDGGRRGSAANGEFSTTIANSSSIVISNAAFLGGDVDQTWFTSDGGSGLRLQNLGASTTSILHNVAITGGGGRQERTYSIRDQSITQQTRDSGSAGGGNAFVLSTADNSLIAANNIVITAGDAGTHIITSEIINEDLIQAATTGGEGITGNANLNILNGLVIGSDGGDIRFNPQQQYNWKSDLDLWGGDGINGNTGLGNLKNIIVTAGNAGKVYLSKSTIGYHTIDAWGGNAFNGSFSGIIQNGNFYAGSGMSDIAFTAGNTTINAQGGSAIINSGTGTISNGLFQGGDGGKNIYLTITGSTDNEINLSSGNALSGGFNIEDGVFKGGNGGSIYINRTSDETVTTIIDAVGGHAIEVNQNSIINGGVFQGGNAGTVVHNGRNNTDGIPNAILDINVKGGHGILHTAGNITINDGTFIGGSGGKARFNSQTNANFVESNLGLGAFFSGGSVVINGGQFTGGNNGTLIENSLIELPGTAIIASNSTSFSLNGGIVNGHLDIKDTPVVSLNGGTIAKNIYLSDNIDLNVDNDLSLHGSFIHDGGTITTTIDEPSDGSVFKRLSIDNGTFTFSGNEFISATNAMVSLKQNGSLDLQAGGTLALGTDLNVGYGSLTSQNNLELDKYSTLRLGFNGVDKGSINISGNLNLDADRANVQIIGTVITNTGSVSFGSIDNITDINKIKADFGWLVKENVIHNTNTTLSFDPALGYVYDNNLYVNYEYNSFTNHISKNEFMSTNHFNLISNLIKTNFFSSINNAGSKIGQAMIRFSETQEADVVDSIFQNQQQVAGLIAARNNEMRSNQGLASSRPNFSKPNGVAGPFDNQPKSHGWIRGYRSKASYDAQSTSPRAEALGYGTVIGFDKYVNNNLLMGVAGTIGRSDSLANNVYNSDTEIYNGSVYATIGGYERYVDMAFSLGKTSTDVINYFDLPNHEFNSTLTSFYIGGGQSYNIGKRTKIIPEVSFLYSKYNQDAYEREGMISKSVHDYTTYSKLLSLGVNISTYRQIHWLNHALALLPSFNIHWLHEFNTEISNVDYNFASGEGLDESTDYYLDVRDREANMLKYGLVLSCWNWLYHNIKFDLNYDFTLGKNRNEQILSGKIGIIF